MARCKAIAVGGGHWSRCEREEHDSGNHIDKVWLPVNKLADIREFQGGEDNVGLVDE